MRFPRAASILLLPLLATVGAVAQVVTINQSFTGTTAPGWTLGGTGYTPILTANGGGDTNGNGWLRLTSASGNESTFAKYDTAFNAANATVAVKFDFATYGGSGADGITFFLADASKTFGVGAYGGSLGYAQKTAAGGGGADISGMNGGYVGVGIDEFGNFSNPTEGRVGGVGSVPNAIAVRGPGQGLTGYDYLGGTGNLGANSIAFPTSGTRPTGVNTRSVEMILTATNQLTIYMSSGGGPYVPLYTIDLSGYARPDQLVMGFAGSTGGSTDIHEIQNVTLTSVAANLWSNAGGDSTWATGNDWHGGSVPATGADVLLDNTYVGTAQTIDVGAGQTRSIRSLQIDAPFAYTLNNGTIEFNNNGILGPSGILVSPTHGSANQTINSNLIADNAIEIQNASSGTLSLTGGLSLGANTVTVDGSGNTTMSGAIAGTGGLVKNDSGTLTLSGANSYSGGTTLNTGTLTANNNSALGSGALTVNGGTLASTAGSTIGNAIALQGNAGFSGITTAGTLTQTNGSYTLNLANATQSGTVNLSNNATGRTLTVDVDGGTSAINGVIQDGGVGAGAGSLTKTGAGTLTLGGANTYSGTTTVSGGTLQLGASNVLPSASALNLAGGTLNLAGFSNRVANLTFSNGATLDFGAGASNSSFVFANLTPAPSGVLTINNYVGPDSSNFGGTGDFLGTATAGLSVLNQIYFSGFGPGATENTTQTNAGNGLGLAYRIAPTAITWGNYTWISNSSQSWNTNGNWSNGNRNNAYADFGYRNPTQGSQFNPLLDASRTMIGLRFDANATGSYIIGSSGAGTVLTMSNGTGLAFVQQQSSLAQTLSPRAITLGSNTVFDVTGSGDLTVGAPISGTASLTKTGTGGRLILSGANAYSGGTSVQSGVLQARNSAALGTGTAAVLPGGAIELYGGVSPTNAFSLSGSGVANGGALRNANGSNTASGTVTLAGDSRINSDTGTLTLSGNLTSAAGNSLSLGGAGNITVGGTITTGSGSVTIDSTGTGTVTFQGAAANTYTGNTVVNGGTLNLSKTANIVSVAGDLVINGGTVNETNSGQIAATSNVTLTGGTFALAANRSNTLASVDSALGSTVSLGSGSVLTINGAGNGVMNGTVTGAGALATGGTGSLALGAANSYSGGTTIGSVVTAMNSSSLGTGAVTINGGGNLQIQDGITLANNFTLNSAGTGANDGAIQNVAGSNTISGTVTLGGASRVQSDSGTLTIAGNVSGPAQNLNVGGSGNTVISGVVGTTTGAVIKDGSGTLTLSNANTYTGGTTVNAGTLALGASERLADAGAVTVASGANFTLNNYTETIGGLSGAGVITLGTGKLIVGSGGASSTFSGSFAGGDTGTLTKTGAGTLTLGAGMNLAGGNLILSGGTLNLGGFSSTFGTLSVTASSTIDFGTGSASILNLLGNLDVSNGATLTIADWTNTVDYFYAQYGDPGATIRGRISFAGYSGVTPTWQSFDHEITPVPEPSVYGAGLLGLCLLAAAFRRRRSA